MTDFDPITADGNNSKRRFAPLVERWKGAIKAATEHRKKEFDCVADEARRFFDGKASDFWEGMAKQASESTDQGFLAGSSLVPQFKISLNRMFDAVAMFGPALYHQNPTIAVTSRPSTGVSIDTFYAGNPQATQILDLIPALQSGQIQDPNVGFMVTQLQQQYDNAIRANQRRIDINNDHAILMQSLSNYYQNEGHKQDEARLAITEAIVTGLGLLEPILESSPAGGPRIPACRFISNKDFIIDPDACYWRDVTWIAVRRASPRNVVEQKFNLPPGSLKGKHASNTALTGENPRQKKRHGNGKVVNRSHEIVEYYDLFSKNGAGQNLQILENQKGLSPELELLGDFVYLAICPGCHYPLNFPDELPLVAPPEMVIGEDGLPMMPEMSAPPEPNPAALEATAWPAPFWDDVHTDGGWPICRLTFYENPGKTWPLSMAAPCIGEMKFINWCMSFLADGVAAGSKIYVACQKSAAENLKSQLVGGGGPFTTIELEAITGKNINEIISFLTAPTFNVDIWNMIAQVNDQIDKRLGLNELMYGSSSRQMRSAAEAQYRQSNINIRPDDMASRVEDWLSITAVREIQLLRWDGTYEDVQPIIGDIGARVFAEQIQTRSVSDVTREFHFRVEAGTARKPNKDTRIAQLNELSQYLLPTAQQAMSMGLPGPFNAFMEDLGRAMDIDPTRYMIDAEDQAMMQAQAMQQATMNQQAMQANEANAPAEAA